MIYTVYETIESSRTFPVNIFVAPIENSTFHWHNEYEMIGILKGGIHIRVESELITLKEGDIFLVNPRMIHAIRSLADKPNLCMILQMSPELFDVEENEPGNEKKDMRFYLDSIRPDEAPECGFGYFYRKLAELVNESLKDNMNSRFRIRAQVCGIIAVLFDYAVYDVRFRDPAAQNQQELAVSVIGYLEKHVENENVMEQSCHEFGLSRRSLDRMLKVTTGVTGKEILEDLRVEKAKGLLKNTDKNMNYILDSCGFGSEKTFYRVFRRETGLTPNEFRHKGRLEQLEQYDEQLKGYLDYEVSEVKGALKKILE